MKRMILTVLCGWICAVASAYNGLAGQLDSLIRSSSFLKTSEVGVVVYDLTDNKELYSYQGEKLYRPASIEKVITAVTALGILGNDYQFQTRLAYSGTLKEGELDGNLYVVGGLDPEFMEKDLERLADAVKEAGITSLKGKLVGDVSLLDSIYWGTGWAWDDTPEPFQPYISPLMLNRGCMSVTVTPSAKGDTGTVKIFPESDFYQIDNRSPVRSRLHGEGQSMCSTRSRFLWRLSAISLDGKGWRWTVTASDTGRLRKMPGSSIRSGARWNGYSDGP